MLGLGRSLLVTFCLLAFAGCTGQQLGFAKLEDEASFAPVDEACQFDEDGVWVALVPVPVLGMLDTVRYTRCLHRHGWTQQADGSWAPPKQVEPERGPR
jgi:hypothetical protein